MPLIRSVFCPFLLANQDQTLCFLCPLLLWSHDHAHTTKPVPEPTYFNPADGVSMLLRRYPPTKLHGVTTQKIIILTVIEVKTSKLVSVLLGTITVM
jgi:hypothetical protein